MLATSARPSEPEMRQLTSGDAVSRLFSNTLNLLAHPSYGVDAAVRIVREATCYELAASELEVTLRERPNRPATLLGLARAASVTSATGISPNASIFPSRTI